MVSKPNTLHLDDTINGYLSEEHRQLLRSHHYPTDSITWRQCLNHTSGLYDYAMGGRTFSELIINNPQRVWTRTEQIALAMESGKATGRPCERYNYGDTGYILAGATLEAITDTNLGVALRQLLHYEQLGLKSTWLERFEDGPTDHPPFVNRYFRDFNTTEWDPSMDLYGGGGLISTTADLAAFTHALFNGQLYDKTTTLDLMLQAPQYAPTYLPYALPMIVKDLDMFKNDHVAPSLISGLNNVEFHSIVLFLLFGLLGYWRERKREVV